MKAFLLKISSPDGAVFEGNVQKFIVRGTEGDLAVMADHIPFVTAIKPGKCKIELEDGTVKTGSAESGLLTVSKDRTTLLSGTFSWEESEK